MPGFEVVGEGGTRDDAITISDQQRPDILLVDISLPGGGLQAIPVILERFPEQKIIMLTVSEAPDDILLALKHGARGYVLKGVGSRGLVEVIRTVLAGESYVSPNLSARLLSELSPLTAGPDKNNALADLTEREREVLDLVAAGLSNKRIAIKLDLHEKTVKHHMTHIFAKLGVANRTEAAMALRDAEQATA